MRLAPSSRRKVPATETKTTEKSSKCSIQGVASTESNMTQVGESLMEANLPTNLLTMTAKTKIGTWNVRTMYETGKAAQVANEMRRYDIQVLGICESRWNGCGIRTLNSGEKVLYSGHIEEFHGHSESVSIMMSPLAAKALIEWKPVSHRIMTARFSSKGRKVTFIQCYSPTNDADKETGRGAKFPYSGQFQYF